LNAREFSFNEIDISHGKLLDHKPLISFFSIFRGLCKKGECMSKNKSLLKLIEEGDLEKGEEWLELKDALKPIFYAPNGCMPWTRIAAKEEMKLQLEIFVEALLLTEISSDELVIAYTNKANSLLQGIQVRTFLALPDLLLKWPADRLNDSQIELLNILKGSMQLSRIKRERTLMLVAQFAEMSNSQSRKSKSGAEAEISVESVLKQAGLREHVGYGKQWKSSDGSDTDFVIPWKQHGDSHGIKAYIAVQSSSNDRSRMSSSELHRGAKRFMCSFNGCPASSKNTNDIGLELSAGLLKDETIYVVIEQERQRAIRKAKADLRKDNNSDRKVLLEKRITWLEEYSWSFNKFYEFAKSCV
jgi:hypothetical protein